MAKAASTEGPTKTSVKAPTAAKKPAPPAPTKKVVAKKTAPISSALFTEEPATAKKPVAKKAGAPVAAPAPPVKAAKTAKTAKVPVSSPPTTLPPAVDEEKDGSLFVAVEGKKKTATTDDLVWAKLFNAYLKRDLKQATAVVATLSTLAKK